MHVLRKSKFNNFCGSYAPFELDSLSAQFHFTAEQLDHIETFVLTQYILFWLELRHEVDMVFIKSFTFCSNICTPMISVMLICVSDLIIYWWCSWYKNNAHGISLISALTMVELWHNLSMFINILIELSFLLFCTFWTFKFGYNLHCTTIFLVGVS